MSDFDLDRLGDVWRQQPDPEEVARLQKSAAAVARRARLAQVIDIGAAVAYLASREAGYLTGQTLHVNGGMAMFA